YIMFLFFTSIRRHTSFSRDWSSDVCFPICAGAVRDGYGSRRGCGERPEQGQRGDGQATSGGAPKRRQYRERGERDAHVPEHSQRSEERRVGKECSSRRSTYLIILK